MTPHRNTALCSKLRVLTDDRLPGQRTIYEAAVSARFPTHQVNGIWHFYEEDLPAIMAAFGLRPKAAEPSRTRRNSATVEHAVA